MYIKFKDITHFLFGNFFQKKEKYNDIEKRIQRLFLDSEDRDPKKIGNGTRSAIVLTDTVEDLGKLEDNFQTSSLFFQIFNAGRHILTELRSAHTLLGLQNIPSEYNEKELSLQIGEEKWTIQSEETLPEFVKRVVQNKASAILSLAEFKCAYQKMGEVSVNEKGTETLYSYSVPEKAWKTADQPAFQVAGGKDIYSSFKEQFIRKKNEQQRLAEEKKQEKELMLQKVRRQEEIRNMFKEEGLEDLGFQIVEIRENQVAILREDVHMQGSTSEIIIPFAVVEGGDPARNVFHELKDKRTEELNRFIAKGIFLDRQLQEFNRKQDLQRNLYLMACIMRPSEEERKDLANFAGLSQFDDDLATIEGMMGQNRTQQYKPWLLQNGKELKELLFPNKSEEEKKLYRSYLFVVLQMLSILTPTCAAMEGFVKVETKDDEPLFQKARKLSLLEGNLDKLVARLDSQKQARRDIAIRLGNTDFALMAHLAKQQQNPGTQQRILQLLSQKIGPHDPGFFDLTKHLFNPVSITQDFTRDELQFKDLREKLSETLHPDVKEKLKQAYMNYKETIAFYNQTRRQSDVLNKFDRLLSEMRISEKTRLADLSKVLKNRDNYPGKRRGAFLQFVLDNYNTARSETGAENNRVLIQTLAFYKDLIIEFLQYALEREGKEKGKKLSETEAKKQADKIEKLRAVIRDLQDYKPKSAL